ncbi:DNA polymerase III subunit alpha [Spirochaeta lutea]|uniref:DNA polymerase III subunit alpha n=1 Tax=Spirochaeta lutea TaxID=1480694 RepID=UPI0009DDECDA|nr:DNA polymerase III subunit alpha [Spirochaeta lutea]
MAEFVHLHNHSDFSLLRASSTIGGLTKKARSMAMPALALTDDGNLFGALRFYQACKSGEQPLNPIIGCDFFLANDSRHNKSITENANKYNRLVLLATSELGYRNLMKLSSVGYTEGFYYKPRIDKEVLAQYNRDLVALSGSMGGEIPQLITRNRVDEARKVAAWYRDLFGPQHFYLEMTDHGIPEQKIINKTLLQFSKELDIPLVATNDTYYLDREDSNAQDILLCIGNKRKKNEPGRFKFSSDQFYLKTPEEMHRLFGEIPEALTNTLAIAEMCNLEMNLPGPLLPDFDIPAQYQSPDEYLRAIANQGLKDRYGAITEDLQKRLDYELSIIIGMGFTGYFLIVWDFIRYAKEHDIPVGPGRGSGAGSIVAYCMQITDIDPIKYNLLFERFLNPDRVSMPDFDIDFCFERRQEVIDYVTRKYGSEKVGQIITFGTLKAKAVIRDVARVLDLPFSEADRIAKLIPDDLKITIPKALEQEPKLQELKDQGGVYQELLETAQKLEKLSRHASTHAAGVVIGKDELTTYVPLFRDPKTGAVSTQFTMDLLEDCGLVKMDFLGLKTLTLITNTEKLIRARGIEFSETDIPEDDQRTFEMLGQGKSAAVFQFESEGMQQTLKKAKPTCIEDLIALNALYRPGPMDNIPQFIDSKWGRIPIRYPHPSLESVLKETYGVIVYQEQVMEIVQIIGGFSLGEADILRRAMGKKKEKEMARMYVRYMEGAKQKGIDEKTAEEIFELLKPFAGYGFNKSHAAAYSVLAYKTAYLKANYPAEFMAANLTNEINSPDKFSQYMAETKAMGIPIEAPDINKSDKYFTVNEGRIFFGLMGMKGVGTSAVDEIIQNRQAQGPFSGFEDFLERIDLKTVNRKVVEIMIMCGVFDSLLPCRKALFDNLEAYMDIASAKKESRAFGQTSLFDDSPEDEFPSPTPDLTQEFDLLELLAYEKETMGYYFSGHPMDKFREQWERGTNINLARLDRAQHESRYALVALVTAFRSIITKKGTRMAFGTMEDYQGSLEFVLFPDTFAQIGETVVPDTVLGFIGNLDTSRERPQLIIEEVRQPDEMDEIDSGEIHIRLNEYATDQESLLEFRGFLHERPGNCPVYLHMKDERGTEYIIRAATQLKVSGLQSSLQELEQHPSVLELWKEFPQLSTPRKPKEFNFLEAGFPQDDQEEIDSPEAVTL